MSHFLLHARLQFQRHLRNPMIWVLALAAPIAAHYMLPKEGTNYAVMAVNDRYLVLSPAVIGLQLGVVMAVILTPLSYIFLRAGPTRRQPWQADDMTPARRSVQMLSYWAADTVALWLLMLALAFAGILLSIFRLPLDQVNPVHTLVALILIAAPALSVVAGIRTIFSTRRGSRGAGGDVLFFFLWLGMIIMAASYFMVPGGGSPFSDILGIAAPISGATDMNIDELVLLGPAGSGDRMTIDAMAGVTDDMFLLSRLGLILATGLLVIVFGRVYAPHKFKPLKGRVEGKQGPAIFLMDPVPTVAASGGSLSRLLMEIKLILSPRWLGGVVLAVALTGLVLPFRTVVGPAMSLLLIFMLSAHGARWRGRAMTPLSYVTPTGRADVIYRVIAAILIVAGLCLPSILGIIIGRGEGVHLLDMAVIAVGLPLLAIGFGHVTRSAVTARLVLFIIWYIYLNVG